MKVKNNAIGSLKSKAKVYCEICGCSHTRQISEYIYENTETEINRVKEIMKAKATKEYTCSICKSIVKSVREQK